MWQRERLSNGSTGGSIIAAENQERAPRNCIAVACETPSWHHENVRHSGRLLSHARLLRHSRQLNIGEGEPILRRHERGFVLSGSGRAYHGVTKDSFSLMAAGEPITAARVIRYLSCHEDRLYHCGKRASVSIVAARTAAGESLVPPRGSLPYCHDRNRVFRAFVTESLLLSYHIESLSCCRDCHRLPFP